VHPIRILVVDDDAVCRDALRSIFDHADDMVVVGEATGGLEAVEVSRQLCPDVVVIDVQLPELDGIEVTRRLGCDGKRPAIVCLSVYPVGHDEACAAGAARFLLKDCRARELVTAVRDSADRRRARAS